MNGLLLVNKPGGMTSHDVVRRVRRLFKTRKVGHAGTLDPLATGVLPVAINEGTKALQFLLLADKTYRATVKLGAVTDTQDVEGQILQRYAVDGITQEQVLQEMAQLTGAIEQIPPMYSALKKDGVPLYKLAREGKEVERQPRPVQIDRFDLLRYELPEIDVVVACSKGTYIRTLCHDLGLALGCGGFLTALQRTRVGRFDLNDCLTLEQVETTLNDGHCPLLTLNEALGEHPAVYLSEVAAQGMAHGIAPSFEQLQPGFDLSEGSTCRLLYEDRLLAMAQVCAHKGGKRPGDFKLLRVFNCP